MEAEFQILFQMTFDTIAFLMHLLKIPRLLISDSLLGWIWMTVTLQLYPDDGQTR